MRRDNMDQACRYLARARELLERDANSANAITRRTIEQVERRLSPGDQYIGDAAAEITVLRMVLDSLQKLSPSKLAQRKVTREWRPANRCRGLVRRVPRSRRRYLS